MRRLLIIFLALTALVSCRKVEKPEAGNSLSVQSQFDGSQGAPTRATSTAFEAGDQVGLYMIDYVGGVPSPLKTTGNQADNVCFTSNSSGLLTTNPPVLYTKDLVGKTDIYAYYPYDAQMATKDVNNYEFKIQQSQLGGISASDFCWAKTADGIIPSPSPVRLEFRHQFSKIELTFNVPREYKDGLKIKRVSSFLFMGVVNGVTANMGAQTITNIESSRYETLTPFTVQQGVVTDNVNTPYIYQMIAPAQAYPTGKLFITAIIEFEIGGSKSFEYVMKDNVFGDNATKAGMIHRLNFSVEPGLELVFKGSVIEPWLDAPVFNGTVADAISTEFSATQQSFAPNFGAANRVKVTVDDGTVYDILSGVSVSGGVCKFKFTKESGYPRSYGFRVVGLEFLIGNTTLYKCNLLSDYVYNPTSMNLGLLPFGGNGTTASPYLIRNAVDLDNVRTVAVSDGLYFKQTADIDLAPYLAIGYVSGSVAAGGDGSALAFANNINRIRPYLGLDDGWSPLTQFAGYYDGAGYAIKGLAINRSSANGQALFGDVNYKGRVFNLKLNGAYVKGGVDVGGVAAVNDGQLYLVNVVDGVVSGNGSVGGVAGRSSGVVYHSTNGATVLSTTGDYCGGVVGVGYGSGYGNLVNYGKVTGAGYTGGVCGLADGLRYSYNRGDVGGSEATSAGAIVGGSMNASSVLDNGYWLSSASYVNCGPNGYGSSISAVVTNFATMSAPDMQNSNKLNPASLLNKMGKSGMDWVMAIGGYYNAGWVIPHPVNYVFVSGQTGIVSQMGGDVRLNVVVAGGVSWTVSSSDASIATIKSGVSGTSSGVVVLSFGDNSASSGGGYRSVDITIGSTVGSYKLTMRQSNPL